MQDKFADREKGGFFATPEGSADLLLRMKDNYDGAEPSGSSLAVIALLRLAALTEDASLRETAEAAFKVQRGIEAPYLLSAWMFAHSPQRQVVLSGADVSAFLQVLRAQFRPFETIVWRDRTGTARAYVCENFVCLEPTSDPSTLALP